MSNMRFGLVTLRSRVPCLRLSQPGIPLTSILWVMKPARVKFNDISKATQLVPGRTKSQCSNLREPVCLTTT